MASPREEQPLELWPKWSRLDSHADGRGDSGSCCVRLLGGDSALLERQIRAVAGSEHLAIDLERLRSDGARDPGS